MFNRQTIKKLEDRVFKYYTSIIQDVPNDEKSCEKIELSIADEHI